MKDRISTHPGRVNLKPVEGSDTLFDMTRADDPTQEGTPLNTANILPYATAALLGLSADATPNDAFMTLISKIQELESNIVYSTTDLTAGSSKLTTGTVYLVYK